MKKRVKSFKFLKKALRVKIKIGGKAVKSLIFVSICEF